jgi:hypothetical protein
VAITASTKGSSRPRSTSVRATEVAATPSTDGTWLSGSTARCTRTRGARWAPTVPGRRVTCTRWPGGTGSLCRTAALQPLRMTPVRARATAAASSRCRFPASAATPSTSARSVSTPLRTTTHAPDRTRRRISAVLKPAPRAPARVKHPPVDAMTTASCPCGSSTTAGCRRNRRSCRRHPHLRGKTISVATLRTKSDWSAGLDLVLR